METKKFRWWMLVIPLLLVVTILAGMAIWSHIKPKAVLSSALTKLFSQLETRFSDSPFLLLPAIYDPEGKYTASMELTDENSLLGTVVYDLMVQSNGLEHQVSAQGTVSMQEKDLDLSVYLDTDFMAVSSEDLVQGVYYGITYDTFLADIKTIPLLQFVISDDVLNRWNDSVQNIQEQMSSTRSLPELSALTLEDYRALLFGVAAMPYQTEQCSISLNGESITCEKLDIATTLAQATQVLPNLSFDGFSENAAITASFYLYEKTLVKCSFGLEEGSNLIQLSLTFGMDPENAPISFQSYQHINQSEEALSITVTTKQEENRYAETWDVKRGEEDHSFAYDWDPNTGEMLLRSGAVSEAVALRVAQTETGLQISTEECSQLLNILTGTAQTEEDAFGLKHCVIQIQRGSGIIVPEYKNLSQWSMEDFLSLLSGIGSLIGIRLE